MSAFETTRTVAAHADQTSDSGRQWRDRYGRKHRLKRVSTFPAGVAAPKKVRIYARHEHFIVQWWDPAAKRTLSVRVAGDLIEALTEARKIDARLLNYKTSGRVVCKLSHDELADRFLVDLSRRADAGEVAVSTLQRYDAALRHYRAFCARPEIVKSHPMAASVNRAFRLSFAAHLATYSLNRSERASTGARACGPVLDAARAMFTWAADPHRGNLLPEGFHNNPFGREERPQRQTARDPFGEPDITVPMAVDFINACDAYQLPLFATLILYGLRAAEPIYLFREHLDQHWLKVNCLPELDYLTKGQRDKRLPLVRPLDTLLNGPNAQAGLIFTRRSIDKRCPSMPLFGASHEVLAEEYRRRCRAAGTSSAIERQQIREQLLRDTGGLNYDQIEHEFRSIAVSLKWPKAATLKDFRHLFSTCLENAGVPEFYRRYFMGQSPGRTPIVTYTHLNELQQQFAKAAKNGLAPLTTAIADRAAKLNAT